MKALSPDIVKPIYWELDIYSKIRRLVPQESQWRIKLLDAGTYNRRVFKWIQVTHKLNNIPQTGWKLHISASLFNAEEVLNNVLPILIKYQYNFKVAFNLDFLAHMNNNGIFSQQVGKFITVYSHDDRRLKFLVQELHEKTINFDSPRVKTDKQFAKNSIVYYRYGALLAKYEQTLWGILFSTIEVNGKKVHDDKNLNSSIYNELHNPFFSNSKTFDSSDNPVEKRYIGRKSIITFKVLAHTGTAEVLLCLDLKNKRRCVVKAAERRTAIDRNGNNATKRLKIEKKILKKLECYNIAPKIYESFYDQFGRYCFVQEDLAGENLLEYLQKKTVQQAPLQNDELYFIAKNLAKIMYCIHKQHIIHADLKLGNLILLDTGELRIIDFDSASDLQSNDIILTCGSKGFSTKNRDRGYIPIVQDDIYSYGAVLYYLYCFINPDICPLEIEQTQITISEYNSTIPDFIKSLIYLCLNKKLSSFKEILSIVENKEVVAYPTKINNASYQDKLFYLSHQYLQRAYEKNSGTYDFSQTLIGNVILSDLRGISGTLIALVASSISLNKRSMFLEVLKKLSDSLIKESLPYNTIPGLYVGQSGKALALLYVSMLIGDKEIQQHAESLLDTANHMLFQSVDLFNGLAGRLRTNLIFWKLTGKQKYIEHSEQIVNHLLNTHGRKDGLIFWYNPTIHSTLDNFELDQEEILFGYAHGNSGIADALLDYYLIKPSNSLKHFIQTIVTCIQKQSLTSHDEKSLLWPVGPGKAPILSYWCHGGAGIGLFITRTMHYGIIPKNNHLINCIAYPILNFTKGGAPILCHGYAGSIESLLDYNYHNLGKDYKKDIKKFESILSNWMHVFIDNDFQTSNAQIAFYGYLSGLAGIVTLYSRLNNPRIPNPLSIEFADYILEELL